LLCDIMGGSASVRVEARWLAWEGGAAVRLARAIYEGRDFAGMPVLADALEDAGCEDEVILGHLRGPIAHALGCWALDALLGRS
jgi:hypothetical protein